MFRLCLTNFHRFETFESNLCLRTQKMRDRSCACIWHGNCFSLVALEEKMNLCYQSDYGNLDMSSERFGTAITREDLLAGRVLSCVDGRSVGAVVGTPGGTLGELILMASAIEAVLGRELTQACVERLLAGMINDGGAFYHHTDYHSLHKLSVTLTSEGVGERSGKRLLKWLMSPEHEVRESLLGLLVVPENIGCGHVAAMVSEPSAYGTRRELVAFAVRAFFTRLWDGCSSLHYVALAGEHMETEVLQVTGATEKVFPAFTATADGHSFVYHRDDVAWFRACVSKHAKAWLGCQIDPGALDAELYRLGEVQLKATLSRLADGLPVVEDCQE
jgi:hypothetical protein